MSNKDLHPTEDNVTMVSVEARPRVWRKLALLCVKAARVIQEQRGKKSERMCPACKEVHGAFNPENGRFDMYLVHIQQWKDLALHLLEGSTAEEVGNEMNEALQTLIDEPNYIAEYVDLSVVDAIRGEQGRKLPNMANVPIPLGLAAEELMNDDK